MGQMPYFVSKTTKCGLEFKATIATTRFMYVAPRGIVSLPPFHTLSLISYWNELVCFHSKWRSRTNLSLPLEVDWRMYLVRNPDLWQVTPTSQTIPTSHSLISSSFSDIDNNGSLKCPLAIFSALSCDTTEKVVTMLSFCVLCYRIVDT